MPLIPLSARAEAAWDTGDLNQARSLFERLLLEQYAAVGTSHPNVATTYLNLAVLHTQQRAYLRAGDYYRRALGIRRDAFGETHELVAEVLNDYAILDWTVADYVRAAELHERALAIRVALYGETHPLVATSLANLGSVYRSRGDFPRAVTLQSRALSIRLEHFGETNAAVAASWNNLATAWSGMGEFDTAAAAHRRALAIRRDVHGDTHQDVAASWNNLSVALRALGHLEEARVCAKRAGVIWRATLGETHPQVASAEINLGDILRQEGKSCEAISSYQRALTIWRDALGRHPSIATACQKMGAVRLLLAETSAAIIDFESGLEALREFPPRHASAPWLALPIAVEILYDLSRTIAMEPDTSAAETHNRISPLPRRESLRKALELAESALDVLERMRADLSVSARGMQELRWHDLPAHVLRLQKELERYGEPTDPDVALRAMELSSAWSFLELLANSRSDLSSALPEALAAEEREIEVEGRRLDVAPGDPTTDAERVGWESRRDSFVRLVREKMPRFAALRYPRPARVEEVRAALRETEVALSYFTSPESSWLLFIDRETCALFELAGENLLAADVVTLRTRLMNQEPLEEILSRLYERLVRPVESRLENRNLIVSTSGVLERVAFEMLQGSGDGAGHSNSGGRALSDGRLISYAPSLSIHSLLRSLSTREANTATRLLAVGNPVYDLSAQEEDPGSAPTRSAAHRYSDAQQGTWTPLPATRVEVALITRFFSADEATVLLDTNASEERVELESVPFGYQHFACHGALEDGPGREPALVLSLVDNVAPHDGFLTISKIICHPRRTRLTVLSACQSGLSARSLPRTGVSSLARAFLLAGSDAVVVSLWPVSDAATARLMVEFYRQIRKEGRAPAEALARARAALRAMPQYAHPSYWAPFILIGG